MKPEHFQVHFYLIVIQSFIILHSVSLMAEGTKQFMPGEVLKGQLCIDYYRNDFAFYDGAEDFRLNIAIGDVSESIRFGFGAVEGNYTDDLVFRIKDPSGNVVFGPMAIPTSGDGYIDTWYHAFNGPFPISNGYNYLELQVSMTGDYYIEFYYPPHSGGYSHDDKHMFRYFDITVLDASGNSKNGRLWSKAWQFWSDTPNEPPTTNRFYGKMMILSDDSIVTQVDCNGFIGGAFSISSNMTGCANSGDIMQDRKSRSGFYTYPNYKIFLNDPDSLLFPTAKLKSGIIEPVTVETNCDDGNVRVGIRVIKDGTVHMLLEVNPSPGADQEDVQIIASVLADPGGNGYNYLVWDGYDNMGNPVASGTEIKLTASYLSGMTHLPMYDIEYNDQGYVVDQIRPNGGILDVFWDDTGIGGSSETGDGCNDPAGCHTWDSDIGENNTLNTWWYVVREAITPLVFTFKRSPGHLELSGEDTWCIGTSGLIYSVDPDINSTSYHWSYSGSGASIIGSGTEVMVDFDENATAGVLSVNGYNAECGEGPVSAIDIQFQPLPYVTLADFEDICYTAPGFALTGGTPSGGTYYVNGIEADSLFPFLMQEGTYQVVYNYTAPTGCSNADTASILLYNSPECEGTIFFPNAFTPNGDGRNDSFRPVQDGISQFRMQVFNRWGEMLFLTQDPTEGWDGSFNGQACPAGVYIYSSSFSLSLRPDGNRQRYGVVTLIR